MPDGNPIRASRGHAVHSGTGNSRSGAQKHVVLLGLHLCFWGKRRNRVVERPLPCLGSSLFVWRKISGSSVPQLGGKS